MNRAAKDDYGGMRLDILLMHLLFVLDRLAHQNQIHYHHHRHRHRHDRRHHRHHRHRRHHVAFLALVLWCVGYGREHHGYIFGCISVRLHPRGEGVGVEEQGGEEQGGEEEG